MYQVSESQIESFRRKGHITLPSLARPDEIERFQPAVSEIVTHLSSDVPPIETRNTYGKAFLQNTNLWRLDDTVKDLVFEPRFAQVAAALLGVERVRLYHDQALFKEPGGGATPWHQDQYYWPLDTDKTITMWMPLVNIDDSMGIITFANGSHEKGSVSSLEISDESETALRGYVEKSGFQIERQPSMNAGDASFHLGWTIHSAGRNRSARSMREVMTVIYFADGAKVTEPANQHQQADLEAWLDGLPAGSIAAGPLNPVLN
jgi:ectoine hydroxylase-related dioxygenase (phytanoyl-CoA dioxygenase family)